MRRVRWDDGKKFIPRVLKRDATAASAAVGEKSTPDGFAVRRGSVKPEGGTELERTVDNNIIAPGEPGGKSRGGYRVPIGRHKGQTFQELPTSYLWWLAAKCDGVPSVSRAAREYLGELAQGDAKVARLLAELETRFGSLPPEAPKPPPYCQHCQSDTVRHQWQAGSDGRRAIRVSCRTCKRFIAYAPQTDDAIRLADAEEPFGKGGAK